VTSAPPSSLFFSKDAELLTRALMIRRLSFALFCTDMDQLLSSLPSIQEKLVDILKAGPGMMHIEVI